MLAELASWRKLTEFVTDHVFRYINWYVNATVVDGDCLANHVWRNCASTRPSFDNSPIISRQGCDLFRQLYVDVWTFFQ